ncbi:MAG: D-alanyl-lipoteichoic acid biosynthesis protein DltD [Nitrospinota bacterium]|nr:D-alanyl-lipoteichoic acid biosynthesis protein DltD [Nitrospinota bacterium]
MYTHKGFVKRYFALALLLASPLGVCMVFLVQAGEQTHFARIAAEQLRTGAVYGTALNQNNFLYKLELASAARPDVIVLGSSRAMQLRKEFFNQTMINCGGAMNSTFEGLFFLQRLLERHRPQVDIITLDFWWFALEGARPERMEYHSNSGDIITAKKLYTPLAYLAMNKIPPKVFWRTLVHGPGEDVIGIQAIVTGWGIRPDGSVFYSQVFDMEFEHHDIRLAQARSAATTGQGHYKRARATARGRMDDLGEIINLLRQHDVTPIFIMTPLAPPVMDAIGKEKLDHVDKLEEYARQAGVELYDFHDARAMGSTECEFLDGLHGGDVANQRMLLEIARINPESALAPYLNVEAMSRSVREYGGNVISAQPGEKWPRDEVDFLRLGCVKKKRPKAE